MANRSKEARTRGPDPDAPQNKPSTKRRRTRGAGYTCNRGRPTDYTPELVDAVKLMLRGGATVPEIARALGVEISTVNLWMVQHPEFSEAFEQGKEFADRRAVMSLYQRVVGYDYASEKIMADGRRIPITEHIPPDPNAAFKWLGARKRSEWTDALDVNLTGELKVENTETSARELAMQVLALMQQAQKEKAE